MSPSAFAALFHTIISEAEADDDAQSHPLHDADIFRQITDGFYRMPVGYVDAAAEDAGETASPIRKEGSLRNPLETTR